MKDLAIRLENRPGALAEMGDALGKAGVSIEGGGGFVFAGQGIVPSSQNRKIASLTHLLHLFRDLT